MTITASASNSQPPGPPRWIRPSLNVKEGRDPLGLQTTTQDRLMPRLLPGILELSRRARYFSFHAFLLDTYRGHQMRPDGNALSTFIKAREWEFGLAVLLCPHACGSSPVGASSLRRVVAQHADMYVRGESVESAFGGYGLYYRSPLAELGIVARAGTQLGDRPTPIDVLRDTDRARRLAEAFGDAVAETEYISTWMLTTDPIPADVLVEYARVACLCQLRERPVERDAVHDALFGQDAAVEPLVTAPDAFAPAVDLEAAASDVATGREGMTANPVEIDHGAAVAQRRRSVAHFLSLIEENPHVVDDEGAYREGLWAVRAFRSDDHERVGGQWAGLIAKDVWQDALCSIWSDFCRTGFHATSVDGMGLTWEQVRSIAEDMAGGPPVLVGGAATSKLRDRIASGEMTLPGLEAPVRDAMLEDLRAATDRIDSAASGLIVILELHRRAADRSDAGWLAATAVRSSWQPSLAAVLRDLTAHLESGPTVSETLWWIVQRYVFIVHERIAYSKLPDHTFRFRWEEGHVRFYDNGLGRFPLAAIRRDPLSQLTYDLALWSREASGAGLALLTDRGRLFLQESLQ
ncbi:hypothetical protein ACFVDI_05680 [Nocardioides sp. NPDC057767]|uniref:hypothetical protein n=1 Tax=unclassified Nocardioides TaxID=2615069 RepID=UPI003670245C